MIRLLLTASLVVSAVIFSAPIMSTPSLAKTKVSKIYNLHKLNSLTNNPNYKVLALIRHGKASKKNKVTSDKRPKGSKQAKLDIERPLTRRGSKDSKKLAKLVSKIEFKNVGLWGSIAQRVQETAQPIIKSLRKEVLFKTFEEELYYADVAKEMELRLSSPLGRNLNHAIFIGHGQTTMDLFNQLTGAKKSFLPTGGVVFIVVKAKSWGEVFNENSEHVEAYAWSPNDNYQIKGSDVPAFGL